MFTTTMFSCQWQLCVYGMATMLVCAANRFKPAKPRAVECRRADQRIPATPSRSAWLHCARSLEHAQITVGFTELAAEVEAKVFDELDFNCWRGDA